jgi:hypothetical protein
MILWPEIKLFVLVERVKASKKERLEEAKK